ncbi:3-methyl-2-oxobutanoate hydroxymethyltransferase [Thermosulfurimonas dismutans]|uniref:3-methyl-2-oxobutanoate hydroxymethyltransferase n=1 Tax=Thermosulfurimonas dismutans TaxID=999894 RepID=A0A179D6C3_9BACT|nr:3-methyl-2-oxobutanoate hydroxymethyltransferase [Thermosulfurimonas dismutans]OAQ21597.1 3-methyl-2-oxobutanoate hydroxymethyltransferase [Thermosulfurimonas dismutans]
MARLTIPEIQAKKGKEPIVALTAYDVISARLAEEAGVELILIGDSAAMVVLGHEDTLPITMEEMLIFSRAVARGARKALLVGDMPFLSYQTGPPEAILNAGRFLKEGGCQAVKIEGGEEVSEIVNAVVKAGIPVLGHIGLTPQRASALGGYKVQGRDLDSARKLMRDAEALISAGVFALILECVPSELARRITEKVPVPTIGIGAGPHTDGQILVFHDVVGLWPRFKPKFVRTYAEVSKEILRAVSTYAEDVKQRRFPGPEESFRISEEVLRALDS